MTDKEKIKAEVERCISDCKRSLNRVHRCSWVDAVTMLEDTLEYISKFIDSLPEEPISEDLEEYAESVSNYLIRNMPDAARNAMTSIIKNCIEVGADWKEKQLMKDVVLETTIIRDDDGCAEDGNYSSWLEYEDYEVVKMPKWAKEGDKVKLIIVKED